MVTSTVHIAKDQWHLAWDRSIPPLASVPSGSVVEFDAFEASNGQVHEDSKVEDMAKVDFSRVDQVAGPIFVEGAEPGDSLEIELSSPSSQRNGAGPRSFPSSGSWRKSSPIRP